MLEEHSKDKFYGNIDIHFKDILSMTRNNLERLSIHTLANCLKFNINLNICCSCTLCSGLTLRSNEVVLLCSEAAGLSVSTQANTALTS